MKKESEMDKRRKGRKEGRACEGNEKGTEISHSLGCARKEKCASILPVTCRQSMGRATNSLFLLCPLLAPFSFSFIHFIHPFVPPASLSVQMVKQKAWSSEMPSPAQEPTLGPQSGHHGSVHGSVHGMHTYVASIHLFLLSRTRRELDPLPLLASTLQEAEYR